MKCILLIIVGIILISIGLNQQIKLNNKDYGVNIEQAIESGGLVLDK